MHRAAAGNESAASLNRRSEQRIFCQNDAAGAVCYRAGENTAVQKNPKFAKWASQTGGMEFLSAGR